MANCEFNDNGESLTFKIDITDIFCALTFLQYKIKCFSNGKNYSIRHLALQTQKVGEEYLFYVSFSMPKSAIQNGRLKFNLQQICVDEFNKPLAVCRSLPFEFIIQNKEVFYEQNRKRIS